MSLDEKGIKYALESMYDSIEKDQVELYKKIIEGSKIKIDPDDPETFYFSLIYGFDNFLRGLIKHEISKNNEVLFILKNYMYVNNHFEKMIISKEGTACCADKSRTIIRRLLKWYKSGEKIEFDYTGEYTFHLPKVIFKTHDEIIIFYEGIQHLYYGHPVKYLEALKQITDIK